MGCQKVKPFDSFLIETDNKLRKQTAQAVGKTPEYVLADHYRAFAPTNQQTAARLHIEIDGKLMRLTNEHSLTIILYLNSTQFTPTVLWSLAKE